MDVISRNKMATNSTYYMRLARKRPHPAFTVVKCVVAAQFQRWATRCHHKDITRIRPGMAPSVGASS